MRRKLKYGSISRPPSLYSRPVEVASTIGSEAGKRIVAIAAACEVVEHSLRLGLRQLEESTMRRTKINAKRQVTIPAELERFRIKKGTRIDWKKDGSRLVLTPITRLRRKS